MIRSYCAGVISPDVNDEFPKLFLSPDLGGSVGTFLELKRLLTIDFSTIKGKELYQACVKVFNIKVLNKKVDTPWRTVLKVDQGARPEWRALYKPPLVKRVGDLQWRILHGAIAVNAFLNVINPGVGHECPFCSQRETLFHAFLQCERLRPLFLCLQRLFNCFNIEFTMKIFIFGFKYVQHKQNMCKLLNFILGQAKMAVYVSRKNKIDHQPGDDVLVLLSAMVKSRILIDFRFYKLMQDFISFEEIWCCGGALCTVMENELYLKILH